MGSSFLTLNIELDFCPLKACRHMLYSADSLFQWFLFPGKLGTCTMLKYNSALVSPGKCLLLNVLIWWFCSEELEACCMWLNSFSFHAVKNQGKKASSHKCKTISPRDGFCLIEMRGRKQFSKRINSAEEKCTGQNSNMVNQKYKLESMEIFL